MRYFIEKQAYKLLLSISPFQFKRVNLMVGELNYSATDCAMKVAGNKVFFGILVYLAAAYIINSASKAVKRVEALNG